MIHQSIELSPAAHGSSLRNWELRASVRDHSEAESKGYEINDTKFDPFSRALFPLAIHPVVASRGLEATRRLLGYRLMEYLEFTSVLEVDAVIPACRCIARDRGEYRLTRALEKDIFKIVVDESYHALCAESLLDRVAGVLEEKPSIARPSFLCLYDKEMKELSGRQQHLSQVFFVIVSETLITGSLVRLPSDPKVMPAVRDIVRAHAADEALHHGYFARVLHEYWERMSVADRDFVGPRIGPYMRAFLNPDATNIRHWLRDAGFSGTESDLLIEDAVFGVQQQATIRASARSTIQHLQACGAMDHAATSDSLHELMLV